jgi:hypothetical protein
MSEILDFPEIDQEAEAASWLAWVQGELARRDAERVSRPAVDYSFKPQQQSFIHTPAGGAVVLALIHQAGYPKAQLVGSTSKGLNSCKDIDILIPLFFKKDKIQCIEAMRALFNPNELAKCRGWDGFGMVAKPHGVLDFFFNCRSHLPAPTPNS